MAKASQICAGQITGQLVTALETAMHQQGVSRSELAKMAGVGRPYLHRVLAGEQTPTLDWIERVADALQLQIDITISARPEAK